MKDFYKRLAVIAIPMALQQLISTGVNFIDTFMIGRLGEVSIASVGLSNKVFFIFSLLLFGMCSGGTIFFSQFWGKKDLKNISKTTSLVLITGIILSLGFFLPAYFIPEKILSLLSPDINVINSGASYLKIISLSYTITAIIYIFEAVLRSTENTVLPMTASIITVVSNIILNYILIFGKFGFPEMRESGAALGTVISRFIQIFILFSFMIKKKHPGIYFFREFKNLSFSFTKKFFEYALPTTVNEFLWSLGITFYTVVFSYMGTNVIAAKNVVDTIEGFVWAILTSFGNSTAVIIGKEIGASRFENAFNYTKKLTLLTVFAAVILAFALFFSSGFFADIFNVTDNVKNMIVTILTISCIFIPLRAWNMVGGVGILRAGGDAKFFLLVDVSSMWLIGIPMAFLGSKVFKLPYNIVFLLTMSDEIFKSVIIFLRIKSKKWAKNIVGETN